MDASSSKLLDQVRDAIRRKHYSVRTEAAGCEWGGRYIPFHGKKPLPGNGICGNRAVSDPSGGCRLPQNQALFALIFFISTSCI